MAIEWGNRVYKIVAQPRVHRQAAMLNWEKSGGGEIFAIVVRQAQTNEA